MAQGFEHDMSGSWANREMNARLAHPALQDAFSRYVAAVRVTEDMEDNGERIPAETTAWVDGLFQAYNTMLEQVI